MASTNTSSAAAPSAGTSSGMCTRHSADSAVSPSVRAAASRLGDRRSKPGLQRRRATPPGSGWRRPARPRTGCPTAAARWKRRTSRAARHRRRCRDRPAESAARAPARCRAARSRGPRARTATRTKALGATRARVGERRGRAAPSPTAATTATPTLLRTALQKPACQRVGDVRGGLHEQDGERRHEAGQHRQRAQDRGGVAAPALEVGERDGAIAPGGVMKLAAARAPPARPRTRASTNSSATSAICAAPAEARALQPGGIDAGGERLHAEILHGAQIVEASPSAPAPAPAASAGRASGSATRQNAPAEVRPSVRATSSTQTDCCTKLARAVR